LDDVPARTTNIRSPSRRSQFLCPQDPVGGPTRTRSGPPFVASWLITSLP